MINGFTAIVLAAGKGTRIKAKKINKVMYPLAGKPIIGYTIEMLQRVGFTDILIVVGFKKQSIINYFGDKVNYVEQKIQQGTAHALKCALTRIPSSIKNIFVCYSDDTAFYPDKVISKLIIDHQQKKAKVSLLTVIKNNPIGLGRIIRDSHNLVIGIIEEKNTNEEQKKIKEINTGCYCFNFSFIKKYLPLIKKDSIKHEYYLTDIIDLAIKYKQKVNAVKINQSEYFYGVNTKEQLIEADRRKKRND